MYDEKWDGDPIEGDASETGLVNVNAQQNGMTFWRHVGKQATGAAMKYGSQFIGAIIGLIIAILMLTIGFVKTAVIMLFVSIGVFFGGPRDRRRQVYMAISSFVKNRFEE